MNKSVKENALKSFVVRYAKEIRAEVAGVEFTTEDNDVCNEMACDNLTDAMHFTRIGDYTDAITLLAMAQDMISVINYPTNEINLRSVFEKFAYAHAALAKLYTKTF